MNELEVFWSITLQAREWDGSHHNQTLCQGPDNKEPCHVGILPIVTDEEAEA